MPRAKRGNLPGFPVETVFETREQLDQYLSGDTIQCLLCGREFQLLDTHLRGVHGLTSDDYRKRYGIGSTVGLQSSRKMASAKNAMTTFLEENPGQLEKKVEALKSAPSPSHNGKTKPLYWKNERTKHDVSVWYEMGRRVIAGESLASISRDADMPSYVQLKWAFQKYPEFGSWWRKNVEPYRVNHQGANLTAEARAAKAASES